MENKNNKVTIIGELKGGLVFRYEAHFEKFYSGVVQVMRASGKYDDIHITVSERLLMEQNYKSGDTVKLVGEYRSYNEKEDDKYHLRLTVFVKEISLYNSKYKRHANGIYLNGFIVKEPVYRTTPLGREITDLLIAVNRGYHKSAYIPAIAWGRNAAFAKLLKVGDKVEVYGRIQSRKYVKRMPNGEMVTKTAYEVSVNEFNKTKEVSKSAGFVLA